MAPIFRFAPSPTGYLHLGHALSAARVWRAAEAAGGSVLLRIEDVDPVRSRPEFVEAILEDIAWLGFAWTGAVRRQSEHLDDYRSALDRLAERGLLYRCRLSRSDIAAALARVDEAGVPAPRDPDGAPRLPLESAVASDPDGDALDWNERGEGPDGERGRVYADPQAWGDVVLARKDTPTSYHLAVTVDDALQNVTHVVRGQDLFHATAAHRLLQRLLGLPAPIYAHHRLLTNHDGRKLGKSVGSRPIRELRAEGWSPEAVFRAIDGIPGA